MNKREENLFADIVMHAGYVLHYEAALRRDMCAYMFGIDHKKKLKRLLRRAEKMGFYCPSLNGRG